MSPSSLWKKYILIQWANFCCQGRLSEFKDLLRQHPSLDINTRVFNGLTALHYACIPFNGKRKKKLIAWLLDQESLDPNVFDENGFTPLIEACQRVNLKAVRLLLSNGKVDVNASMNHTDTPLIVALKTGNPALMNMLLSHPRVFVPLEGDGGTSALAVACFSGNLDIVRRLLAIPSAPRNPADLFVKPEYPLGNACIAGHHDVVSLLLSTPGFDVDIKGDLQRHPLFLAARGKHLEVISVLLRDPRIHLDKGGEMVLGEAIADGNTELVRLLLGDGRIDPNYSQMPLPLFTRSASNALEKAIVSGKVEIVEMLLLDGRVDARSLPNGKSPLRMACKFGFADCAKLLLQQPGTDPFETWKEFDEETNLLLIACGTHGCAEVAVMLYLRYRLHPWPGVNPLYAFMPDLLKKVATGDHRRLAKMILDDPLVDPNLVDADDISPLTVAIKYGNDQVAEMFLRHPSLDFKLFELRTRHPFLAAYNVRNPSMILAILQHPTFDPSFRVLGSGETPLMLVCTLPASLQDEQIMKKLLEDPRVDLNAVDSMGTSPLEIALRLSYKEKAILLLRQPRLVCPPRVFDLESDFAAHVRRNSMSIVLTFIKYRKVTPAQCVRSGVLLESTPFPNECCQWVRAYVDDPKETLARITRLCLTNAADTFVTAVFFSDGFLRRNPSAEATNALRFFKICKKLPMEIQMTISLRQQGKMNNSIPQISVDHAIRRICKGI